MINPNNEKYIIALDLDGTLLDDDKNIMPRTKEILIKLSKLGHKIILASGRPYRNIKRYYEELELSTPVITYSGMKNFSPVDPNFNKTVFNFDLETLKDITMTLYENKAIDNAMCENDDEVFIIRQDPELIKFFSHENQHITYGDFRKTVNTNIVGLLLQSKTLKNREMIERIVSSHKGYGVRSWWDYLYSEIYFKGIDKGTGLKALMKHFNIDKNHVIAFGDNINDLGMFNSVGISIAMRNATKEAKDSAKYISEFDNNHEGIYFELNKIFKLY